MRSVILLIAVGVLVGCRKQPVYADIFAACEPMRAAPPWTDFVRADDAEIYFCEQSRRQQDIRGPVVILRPGTQTIFHNGWSRTRPELEDALVEEGFCDARGYTVKAHYQSFPILNWCREIQRLR